MIVEEKIINQVKIKIETIKVFDIWTTTETSLSFVVLSIHQFDRLDKFFRVFCIDPFSEQFKVKIFS